MARGGLIAVWLSLALPVAALADGPAPAQADLGGVGLLETPGARMLPDGTVAAGFAVVGGLYRTGAIDAQFLPWLETTLHETVRPARSGLTELVESSAGLKARLLTESRWRPALAVGLRDLAGGRFSAEYLVLGKRWYDLDFSLGLGWGRLGEAATLGNPLGFLGGRYGRTRDPVIAPAGPGSWFTGDATAVFGGVSWQTPLPDLVLKLELSGDRRRLDRWETPALRAGPPVNGGLSWRPWPWLELGGGYEHGRDGVARAALVLAPDAPLPRRLEPEALPAPTASVVVDGSRAIAWLDPSAEAGDAYPPAQVVGRALRGMAERAPPGVEEVTVVAASRGLDGVAVSALAGEVRRAGRGRGSAPEIRESGRLEPGAPVSALAALPDGWRPPAGEPWRFQVTPRYEQSPFESLTPVVYRASVDTGWELEVTDGLIFNHDLRWTPAANLDKLDTSVTRALVRPPANRPVRSDLADYVRATPLETFERVALSWLAEPDPAWRTRLSAGWLEEMYGGLGGEALYRPWQSRWALGAEIDPVRKRLPGNTPLFRPHTGSVAGNASLYYESADGRTDGALHAGRYLGGDVGCTLEVTRDFDSGLRLGAFFTGTTGAERLGVRFPQGRDHFDGGLRLSVPLGALPLVPAASRAEAAFHALGRDSGQRVDMPLRLEPLTRPTGYGALSGGWSRLLD